MNADLKLSEEMIKEAVVLYVNQETSFVASADGVRFTATENRDFRDEKTGGFTITATAEVSARQKPNDSNTDI